MAAPSNTATFNINDLSIPQLNSIMQQLGGEIELFSTSIEQLQTMQKKYSDSKAAIERMTTAKEGTSVFVPLTNSLYVPGELTDVDRVMVDVGTGYFVEEGTKSAAEYMGRRVAFIEKQVNEVLTHLRQKQSMKQDVAEVLQFKLEAHLAYQAQMRKATEASAPKK